MKKFTYRVERGEYIWTIEELGQPTIEGVSSSELEMLDLAKAWGAIPQAPIVEKPYLGAAARLLSRWVAPRYLHGSKASHFILDALALGTLAMLGYLSSPYSLWLAGAYLAFGLLLTVFAAFLDCFFGGLETAGHYFFVLSQGPYILFLETVEWLRGR